MAGNPRFPACPEAVAAAKLHVQNVFAVLASQLREAGGQALLGEFGFSAADVLFVHCCNWAESISWLQFSGQGEPDEPDMKVLRDYLKVCREREAYRRASNKENFK